MRDFNHDLAKLEKRLSRATELLSRAERRLERRPERAEAYARQARHELEKAAERLGIQLTTLMTETEVSQ